MSHLIDIIMPCVAGHEAMAGISSDAVVSCNLTAGNRAKIWLLDNGIDHDEGSSTRRHFFSKEVRSLGHDYIYDGQPFNESRLYNIGAERAKNSGAKLIMFANCDLIFCGDWLDKLAAFFDAHPEIYCAAPVSHSETHIGLCYVNFNDVAAAGLANAARWYLCDHPSNWCMTFRKSDYPAWDEAMLYWGADDAIHARMKKEGKQCAVLTNARIDHRADAVNTLCPANFGFDVEAHKAEADRLFKERYSS